MDSNAPRFLPTTPQTATYFSHKEFLKQTLRTGKSKYLPLAVDCTSSHFKDVYFSILFEAQTVRAGKYVPAREKNKNEAQQRGDVGFFSICSDPWLDINIILG